MHNHSFWIPTDNTTHPQSHPHPLHILSPLLLYVCIASQGQGAIRHPYTGTFRLKDGPVGVKSKNILASLRTWFFCCQILLFCCGPDLSAKLQANWPFQTKVKLQMQGSKVVLLYLLDWAAQCQACSSTELEWTIWPLGNAMLKRVLESFRTFRKEVFGFNNCKLSSL